MKKTKGFTLIELLAVIVILAIIALIATPIILKVVDDANKGAFRNSAYGIANAAEFEFAKETLKNTKASEVAFIYVNGVESSNPAGRKLDYKGNVPQNGVILVNYEGKVAMALYNGKYCAEKGYNDVSVVLTEKTLEECEQTLRAD
jgi:prepilin-type N-terminal cleavage/methylation domain-containing protein